MIFLLKLWYFLPAAVANIAPVFARHPFIKKRIGNAPLDFGKNLQYDKRRILGDGKTFLGTFLGLLFGTIAGALQGQPILGLALSAGALFGDIAKSFLKRRAGFERGKPVILVDQLDFVFGAVLFSLPLGFFDWTIPEFILLCLIVLPLHRLSGMFGYFIRIKREPW